MKRLRLLAALIISLLMPSKCWVDLAMWAVWDVPWEEVGSCRGCGYCGRRLDP